MFKRWRCYVALLLCLCCTFATLSLNTLVVKADLNSPSSFSGTMNYYPTNSNNRNWFEISNYQNGDYRAGWIDNSFCWHVKLQGRFKSDALTNANVTNGGSTNDLSNNWYSWGIIGLNISSTRGTISNVVWDTDLDSIFYAPSSTLSGTAKGKDIIQNYGGGNNNNYYCPPIIVEFDYIDYQQTSGSDPSFAPLLSSNFTVSGTLFLRDATANQIESAKEATSDSTTHSKLDTGNSIAQDTNTTTHSIFTKITDFFNSFFENIINTLKSLFIPEDGYFTNWFTRLNTLLSAKLGMLYAPFDLVISVLTALGSASTSEAGIPFPELSWDGQVIIPAQTFYFSSLGSSFNDLRDAVYFGTDVVLLFAFLVLLQRKINLVMRGSEEG